MYDRWFKKFLIMLTSVFRPLSTVKFISSGMTHIAKGKVGETLAKIAEDNKIHIPMACEGSGACGTCQLYITKGMNYLSPITDKENDTLDFAIQVQDNSRLACQASIITDNVEIECEIPKQSRNII